MGVAARRPVTLLNFSDVPRVLSSGKRRACRGYRANHSTATPQNSMLNHDEKKKREQYGKPPDSFAPLDTHAGSVGRQVLSLNFEYAVAACLLYRSWI